MSKNYLKIKDSKVKFIQTILEEIHDEIEFSSRDHKYKVKRNLLTKNGIIESLVSPFSVSSVVGDNFGHFNEKNWDLPAQRSGISKEDLIYNRLLAQVMGCVKGSIIHDYLENFTKGNISDLDSNLTEVIRTETKFNFYPHYKEGQNLIRRVNRNIDLNKYSENNKLNNDVIKSFPKMPKGVLTLDLANINNINGLVEEFSKYLSNKEFNNVVELKKILINDFNFPENTTLEFLEILKLNSVNIKDLNSEIIFESFSSLVDNEFLSTKEFLYTSAILSLCNSFNDLNNYLKQDLNILEQNPVKKEEFLKQKLDLQSIVREKLNKINQTFLLNPEVTSKTLQELKAEEYRLNKDIRSAVKEVLQNLDAGNMIDKLNKIGLVIVAVEQKMSLKAVIGTSDILAMNKLGTLVTLDYKTNKGKLSKDSLDHYSLQLRIYDKMIKELVSDKIRSSPKLQKRVTKLWNVSDYEKALNIICKKEDPILLHISSVDKIKDSDIEQMKTLGLRNILKNLNLNEFDSIHEKVDFLNKEVNDLNFKITELVENVDSCKLIYTPTMCNQYRNNNKIEYLTDKLVEDVFNKEIVTVRSPTNHIFIKHLDLIIPDSETNREIVNDFIPKFNDDLDNKLVESLKLDLINLVSQNSFPDENIELNNNKKEIEIN